jgi:DNA polymerase-1
MCPLAHATPARRISSTATLVLAKLKPLLEDPNRPKLGQNLKYDISVCANHGIACAASPTTPCWRAMCSTAPPPGTTWTRWPKKYLDQDTIHFEDIAGKGAKQLTFDQIPLEQAGPYAAEDADVTLRLHRALWPKVEGRRCPVYREIEMPLVPVLSRIERTGVRIDSDELKAQSATWPSACAEAGGARLQRRRAHRFNMGSPKQIGAIFFDELKLPVVAKTPKGAPSTSEACWRSWPRTATSCPASSWSTAACPSCAPPTPTSCRRWSTPDTGRVHTSYHQAVAATGRLSSAIPNLQNIPIRSDEGRRIRRAFVPEPGCRMLAADYSQIELRIMAHLSGDERLLAAFAPAKTSTAPPPPRSSACRRSRSPASSAAPPRPSTSA